MVLIWSLSVVEFGRNRPNVLFVLRQPFRSAAAGQCRRAGVATNAVRRNVVSGLADTDTLDATSKGLGPTDSPVSRFEIAPCSRSAHGHAIAEEPVSALRVLRRTDENARALILTKSIFRMWILRRIGAIRELSRAA
jgi:hypothetical protein